MIITCEECHKKYIAENGYFEEEDKEVPKCSHCKKWTILEKD
jgi:NAD-dependent SIR2 family protein deacetylase